MPGRGGVRAGAGRPETMNAYPKWFRVALTEEQHTELLKRGGQEAIREWLSSRSKVTNIQRPGIRTISLFSGAGGMDIGFEQAGFRIVAANEIDHFACETYRSNPSYLDSRNLLEGGIDEHFLTLTSSTEIDAVIGGPPCQGYSVAGKMNPDDPRSKMVWKFLDVVESVNPRVFVMENVRALGELVKWTTVRESIIEKAKNLGYTCFYRILDSSNYGVPEKRERVFFIGIKGKVQEELFDQSLAEYEKTAPTVREVLTHLPSFGEKGNECTCTAKIVCTKNPVLRKSPYAGMLFNGAGRPMRLDDVAQTLPASMGGNKTPIIDQEALIDSEKENWIESYHKDLLEGKTPLYGMAPDRMRRLTVREAAAIQTFPKDFNFVGAKTKQYCQIGNAVPVRLAYVVAESVRRAFLSI